MQKSITIHWCASVLNKWFLTPFRDGIRNRRQVSVGDRGVLPTRPRNRRGYALLAHTLGKMRSCATDEHSNTEIRTVVLKNNYIGEIISGRKYIPHSQSPLNVSVRIYIPHSHSKENISVHRYITHNSPIKSFVIVLPLHTILTILPFVLLNASHTVRRKN